MTVRQARHATEKPTPDFTLDEMLAQIGRVIDSDIYSGDGAHTLRELFTQHGCSKETMRATAAEMVKLGAWVRVTVRRIDETGRNTRRPAYVSKARYEEWAAQRERCI